MYQDAAQALGPADVTEGSRTTAVRINCWGTRGSIASPGPGTARYGGNTCCVEIEVGSRSLVFDAGTGIRSLGRKLLDRSRRVEVDVFLTHFHWDHIQGFPFFGPLYHKSTYLRIFGPEQSNTDIQTLFAGQMGPIYFPVPFTAIAARIEFAHFNEGRWSDGNDVVVHALRMRHPSFTVGYRIEVAGHTICYIPDNELVGGTYATDGGDWRDRLLAFIRGADVLLHDAMFQDGEYADRVGWGHSTFRHAFELAVEGGVRRLYFFHHAPERTDHELGAIVEEMRAEGERHGLRTQVDAASENQPIILEGEAP